MGSDRFQDIKLGGFVGRLRADLALGLTEDRLSGLRAEIWNDKGRILSDGRHRVVVLPFSAAEEEVFLAVKAFGKQSALKDAYDAKRGSKSARSFRAAEHLMKHKVGSPEPMGYLERWEDGRLVESYFISAYHGSLKSFKDHLVSIYRSNPDCQTLVSLLAHVAEAIRGMHDSGFCHRDLGNQNIELEEADDDEWGRVLFIDLNRGNIRESLTMKERAQDFSRIRLPGAFLEVFLNLYWDGWTPGDFLKKLMSMRRRFEWWERSRALRHPFRPKAKPDPMWYPEVQDIWIWDEQSAQASIVMNRAERKRHYPSGRNREILLSNAKSALKIHQQYRKLMPLAFSKTVEMAGRIGMALEAHSLDFEKQKEFLNRLGGISVLLRFCHHEGEAQWKRTVEYLDELRAEGYEIMVAILQDRHAVLDEEAWQHFLEYVFEQIEGKVLQVEIGHAINRTKWGIHSPQELRRLVAPLPGLSARYPSLKLVGPACIDFEYHYVVSALENIPQGLAYSGLSHLLYVDRRGAPENVQGKFGLIEKCGLLKAIASHASQCDERVIISEVNWPIKGTGIWSPVEATYQGPGWKGSELSVSEEDYGCFMLRYLVLALCSGFVDQVYWWRLVSHGFGLVDERAEGGWRARPGYRMLEFFLKTLGKAVFLEKLELNEGEYAMRFQKGDQEIVMAWVLGADTEITWPFKINQAYDVYGKPTSELHINGSPIYFFVTKQE